MSRKKVLTKEEKNQNLEHLFNDIVLQAHLRYSIDTSCKNVYEFTNTDTFKQIVHDITSVTGIGNKSKNFFESKTVYQTLSILLPLAVNQYYVTTETSEKGVNRELSELGKEYPYGLFLQITIKYLICDLMYLFLYKAEVTKELKKSNYSIKAYKEFTEEYITSSFHEFHDIVINAKAGSKDSVDDKFTKLEKKKQSKTASEIVHPVEKAGRNVLSHFEKFEYDEDTEEYKTGVLTQRRTDRKNNLEQIGVSVYLNLSELDKFNIVKELTPFDNSVHNAVATLIYHNKKQKFSIYELALAMGCDESLPSSTAENIRNSLEKMSRITVTIDNKEESDRYNYSHYYTSKVPLLPVQVIEETEKKTGNITNIYYKKLNYDGIKVTPLFDYALLKKQVTTLPLICYQAPLSKTDTNIRIRDYLLFRIKTDKADSVTNKIRINLDSVLKDANITKELIKNKETLKDSKKRAKKAIETYLNYWSENTDLLESWRMEKNQHSDNVIVIKKN